MSRLIALSFCLLVSATAHAQSDKGATRVQYKAVTELEFTGAELEGEIVKPQLKLLGEPQREGFNPLIRLRQDFTTEMKHSVDEVK